MRKVSLAFFAAFLVISIFSCDTFSFDVPPELQLPAETLSYKDALPPDHPMTQLFDSAKPEVQEFSFVYQAGQQFDFTLQTGARIIILSDSLERRYIGQTIRIQAQEATDPLAVQGGGLSLWYRSQSFLQSGGMMRIVLIDASGAQVIPDAQRPPVIRSARIQAGSQLFVQDRDSNWQITGAQPEEQSVPGEGLTLDPGFYSVSDDGVYPLNIFYHGQMAVMFQGQVDLDPDLDFYSLNLRTFGWRSNSERYSFDVPLGPQYWVQRRSTIMGVTQWYMTPAAMGSWWNLDIKVNGAFVVPLFLPIQEKEDKELLFAINFSQGMNSYEVNTNGAIPLFTEVQQVLLIVDKDGNTFRSNVIQPSSEEDFWATVTWTSISAQDMQNKDTFYAMLDREEPRYRMTDLPALNR